MSYLVGCIRVWDIRVNTFDVLTQQAKERAKQGLDLFIHAVIDSSHVGFFGEGMQWRKLGLEQSS